MQDGRIAAERYGAGYGPDTRFVSWSMAKTITGVMIGMMVADGLLHIDEPAPVAMWQRPGDPRAEITLRHLLQMRSGLRHTEAGDQIGRASCRDRGCPYVSISVVAVSLKKKHYD